MSGQKLVIFGQKCPDARRLGWHFTGQNVRFRAEAPGASGQNGRLGLPPRAPVLAPSPSARSQTILSGKSYKVGARLGLLLSGFAEGWGVRTAEFCPAMA
ncbi:hypothetical protein BV20DRAFT_409287 [Pilatotrama ljubarskyi]|nr:hypothetical protein BV20DRAFT_409287 [Pilatotrama ljubarskyi]